MSKTAAPQDHFDTALDAARPMGLGLAVSGGGDSVALMHLATDYARRHDLPLRVVTVDHGLRAESADEADFVSRIAGRLGVAHETLHWQGWDGQGNLQAAARQARYGLIGEWARGHGLSHVALGHTRDDLAETFLMRLARGAGVDGLSSMVGHWRMDGINWLRPLLACARDDLRVYLRAGGVAWCEDPSNKDMRFERVRMREALDELARLGLTSARLAEVAGHLAQAREALDVQTRAAARSCLQTDLGDVVIDVTALSREPADIRRRLLTQALLWVNSAAFAPRARKLAAFTGLLLKRRKTTLQGCLVLPAPEGVRLCREYAAVASLSGPTHLPWDGRWRLEGPHDKGLQVRALGEDGLRACPDWRSSGRARASLLASPGIWRGTELVAAPLADRPGGWRAYPDALGKEPMSRMITH